MPSEDRLKNTKKSSDKNRRDSVVKKNLTQKKSKDNAMHCLVIKPQSSSEHKKTMISIKELLSLLSRKMLEFQ